MGATNEMPEPLKHPSAGEPREVATVDGHRLPTVDPELLHLSTSRTIRYTVRHTRCPVFSPGEPALRDATGGRPVLLVVDRIVDELYGDDLRLYASRHLECVGTVVIEATESMKELRSVEEICRTANRLALPRHGIIVAVGGGILLDIAGFAAAMFRRGVDYLRVPTTLVGLIDAGLGIKQGVNFDGRKNLLGAMYPPIGVVNDFGFLRTLPLAELSCGLAEIIKIAMVTDATLFATVETHGAQLRRTRFREPGAVARAVLLRASTLMLRELEPNLFEEDRRRLVDFGHTFSPQIEAATDYTIAHGEAVALDMLLSTAVAVGHGVCGAELLVRLHRLIAAVGLPVALPGSATMPVLLDAVSAATRHRAGQLNLVVPTGAGTATFLQAVSAADVRAALTRLELLNLQRADARVCL